MGERKSKPLSIRLRPDVMAACQSAALIRTARENARLQALEEAAALADAFATCSCNGKFGRCAENDAPKAIATAIRKLKEGNGNV